MTLTSLTFEELDAILALIEFHDDWDEVSEIVGVDVATLYDKLSEMRDEV
jgi:DNA-binding ferritin-like protein (Dps family)